MSKAAQLRDALLDVLLDAVKNGQVVVDEDGNAMRVTPDSKVLTVALQAAKAFGPATPADDGAAVKANNVSAFLQRYQPTPASAQ